MKFGLSLFVVAVLAQSAARAEKSASSVIAFKVERPLFVVYGRNLASVEIWDAPTGTGVEPGRLGAAKRTTPPGNHEKWVLEIPPDMLAVEIFAIGYNTAHVEVGKKFLPFKGATEIHNALYGRR